MLYIFEDWFDKPSFLHMVDIQSWQSHTHPHTDLHFPRKTKRHFQMLFSLVYGPSDLSVGFPHLISLLFAWISTPSQQLTHQHR